MSRPNLLRRNLCGATISKYIGRGGPPLRAPLPMEDRCTLEKRHTIPCTSRRSILLSRSQPTGNTR